MTAANGRPMDRGDSDIERARTALARGDRAAADTALRSALCCTPRRVDGHYNLGVLRGAAADPVSAARCYGRALVCQNDHVAAAGNLADALLSLDRDREAEAVCLAALRHAPLSAGLFGNLGLVRLRLGARRQASQDTRRALCLDPGYAKAWQTQGLLAHDQSDAADAAYRRAWAGGLRDPGLLVNRGAIAQSDGRIVDAIAFYREAAGLRPDDPDIRANLAAASVDDGDFAAAKALARGVLSTHPEHGLARWIDSWVALAHRDFAHGFQNYDDAWLNPGRDAHPHATRFPLWDGRPLDGALLLWCDQGLGDEILYTGMIADVLALGVDVVLECDRRLAGIFQRSWPSLRIAVRGDPLPLGIAGQSSTLRLPMLFRRAIGDFPNRRSYLLADPKRVAEYKAVFAATIGDRTIGLSWRSGNPRTGTQKSTRLADWDALMRAPDARFVSLQYDDGGETDLRLAANPGPDVKNDIDGLAAQIAALDHVVSISGVTAHLAGALGVPGHVLLPPAPLWYWFAEGAGCPWYPSLTLVRRRRGEGWKPAVQRVHQAMRSYLPS